MKDGEIRLAPEIVESYQVQARPTPRLLVTCGGKECVDAHSRGWWRARGVPRRPMNGGRPGS
jgi:hypothetical protein